MSDRDVLVVGGGVAGLTASIFTAGAGLDTLVVRAGESLLCRNAHLENFPGFPAGVNSRVFLEMTEDQAERSGAEVRDGEVTDLARDADGFEATLADGGTVRATYVVAASKNTTDYLADLDVGVIQRGSNTFLDTDENGETSVDGLYAAGRLAEEHHQTVVAAGHGASVACTLVDESDVPFYHDWVAPQGYFTGRDIEVPPGCEEIDETERRRRERESMEVMREYFSEPHPEGPTMHPNVESEGREDESASK